MDDKKLGATLQRIVERFTSTAVAYENSLATEAQLKKSACDGIAKLLTLKEVDSIKVDHIIEGFTGVLQATDDEKVEAAINQTCGDLYVMINGLRD